MELEQIAEELYGLLPDQFTAARDWRAAQLRLAGERELSAEVGRLRRPTIPAWLVNALVRHRPEEIDRLLELGDALRRAQATLRADELRELNRRRQGVVAALGREARTLARGLGRPVSDPVVDQVEETLRAALADPAVAEAVRTGRLTAPLSYVGLGEVDLDDVVALGPSRGRPVADAGRQDRDRARAALRAAEEAWQRAEQEHRRSEQHRDALVRRAETARERVREAQARVADLEGALAAARQHLAAETEGWRPLDEQAGAAADAVERAASAVASAAVERDRARNLPAP